MLRQFYNRLEARFLLKARGGSLGVGLVGVGGWGLVNALNLMRTRRFDIRGVYDADPEKADRFVKRFGSARFKSLDELLSDSTLSSVVLTAPNPFHVELTQRALEAGRHVFIEKPLASSPEDCRRLGALSATKGLVLQVGHQIRREPAIREIKRRLDASDFGKPILASGWNTQQRTKQDWRTDPIVCPGGSMEQLGIHWVDTFLFLFGQPPSTTGWSLNIPRVGPGPEWGHLDLEFAGGVRGTIDSSYSTPDSFGLRLHCEKGTLEYDETSLFVFGRAGRRRLQVKGTPGGVTQFHEFADCVEGKSRPETDAESAAVVMEVVAKVIPPGRRPQ